MKEKKLYRVDVNYSTYVLASPNEDISNVRREAFMNAGIDLCKGDPCLNVSSVTDIKDVNECWKDQVPWSTLSIEQKFAYKELQKTIKQLLEE